MLHRPYTENKMQQQLKCCIVYLRGTKLQQQMKNVEPFSYGKQNTITNEECCNINQLHTETKMQKQIKKKMLHRSYTETKMQQQLKLLHRLFTGTKLQHKMKNVAPFSYGKQTTTTNEKCCTVNQLQKPKWKKKNHKKKLLHRSYTETKMQQQLKMFYRLFKETKCNIKWKISQCPVTETKMQHKMKMLHRLLTANKMQQQIK